MSEQAGEKSVARGEQIGALRRTGLLAGGIPHLHFEVQTLAPGRWEIFTHGGRRATGVDAVEFARTVTQKGAGEILLTSMDRDGTRAGFNIPLTRAIADAVSVPVIGICAGGGVDGQILVTQDTALRGKKNVIILERTDEALAGDNPLARDIRMNLAQGS